MTWDWTAGALAALAGSHTAVTRVAVLHGGLEVYQLAIVDGSVGMATGRAVLANLSCTLIDPTGALSRGDVDDLLDPYECEIAPYRGVRLKATTIGGYRDELAPLGVFGLTGRDVSDSDDGLSIQIAGQDRAIRYQVGMKSALAIPGATPVEEAIVRLLATADPRVSILAMVSGHTCGPLLYPPDIDVWAEAQKLAESVGAKLYHNRLGEAVLEPLGPASATPVVSWVEGGGLLVDVNRSEDSDTIRNVVIAESTDGTIRAVVRDENPDSPTYAGGRYGERPASPIVRDFNSVEQAQQAATARLVYELGRSETASATVSPNPGIDLDEVATLHRPRAGLVNRGMVVSSLAIPLRIVSGSGVVPMQVGFRKSVLAPNGDVLKELTA